MNINECTINDLKNKITVNYSEMTEEAENARVMIFVDKESRIMVDDTDLQTTLKAFVKSGIKKFTVAFQTRMYTQSTVFWLLIYNQLFFWSILNLVVCCRE